MIGIAKNPKPLTTLAYQFLQRCTVSGTAQGKSKIKAGQPLKRSKISTKKGKGGCPIDDSLPKGGRVTDEKQRLYDQCLNAPTPVLHLSAKDRAREAERFMATLTPPIEGYVEKVKEAAKKSSTKQKLR